MNHFYARCADRLSKTSPYYVYFSYFLFAIFLVLHTPKIEVEWKWAHLFFTYEFGFLKRGLAGQMFNWLSIPSSYENFYVFSSLVMMALITLYFETIRKMPLKIFFVLGGLFLTSPLLLKNIILDWGRFDQIAIIYLFTCLFALTSVQLHRYTTLLLIFSPILLFIHEATILWVFPILWTLVYFEKPKLLLLLIPITGVCLMIILKFGGLNVSSPDYVQALEKWAYPHWIHFSIVNTLTNSFSQSLAMSIPAIMPNLMSKQGIIGSIELISLLSLLFFIRSRILILLTLVSLLIATILFCVALDHFRWMSLMGFIILTSILYAQRKNWLNNSKPFIIYTSALSLVNIFVGPIGIWLTLINP